MIFIKLCPRCNIEVETKFNRVRHCDNCRKYLRKEVLKRFAPKARIKTKIWRKNNHERAIKKQNECYYKNKEHYLNYSKQYRIKNKEKIKLRLNILRNKKPHRLKLINAKIPIECKLCGAKENVNKIQMSVHHIDGNNQNNNLLNLVWICERCHQYIHNPHGINSEMIKIDGYTKKENRKCLQNNKPNKI